jgi:hypothetical protein
MTHNSISPSTLCHNGTVNWGVGSGLESAVICFFAVDGGEDNCLSYAHNCPAHEAREAGTFFMPEGYCVKCKAKKEIVDGVEETMKNGRKAIKGKCPTCGTVMFKILGGKVAATSAAAEPAKPSSPAS